MERAFIAIDHPLIPSSCRFKEIPTYSSPIKADFVNSGAVKSNIGHLEGTSGLAGVIKAIQVLEKGIIPPNANFKRLNPRIDAEFFNLQVSY